MYCGTKKKHKFENSWLVFPIPDTQEAVAGITKVGNKPKLFPRGSMCEN